MVGVEIRRKKKNKGKKSREIMFLVGVWLEQEHDVVFLRWERVGNIEKAELDFFFIKKKKITSIQFVLIEYLKVAARFKKSKIAFCTYLSFSFSHRLKLD